MKLHYNISGQGTPLIILHGLFGSSDNWKSCAAHLSQQFLVINIDLRNHGKSPHDDSISYPLMAEDVIQLLDDLSIDNAFILGHSMGGKVAMQIALSFPDRIKKLIVVDIAPVAYKAHHEEVFAGLNSIDLDTLTSRSHANAQLSQYVEDKNISAFLLKSLYKNSGQFTWRFNLTSLEREYPSISLAPQSKTASTSKTLFIKGMNSHYILAQHKDDILKLFPKAQFKMIEGAGHWPHAEKPSIFNRIIDNFLKE